MPFVFLLLAMISWDRVTTSCEGTPDTVGHYYFRATMRSQMSIACTDDQGLPAICYVTVPDLPRKFGPDIPDPGTGVSVSTLFDPVENPDLLPTPAPGGLSAWPWYSLENIHPVVAVDTAGNESIQCIP